jgi:hypothetical protein
MATKNGITNFFPPLFYCFFWIRYLGWVKIRIRDKHPGSATLTPAYLIPKIFLFLNPFSMLLARIFPRSFSQQ